MTWVGLDVHARSTQAAAFDVLSGELTWRRLPGDTEAVVAWLARLPRPVRACYEAGPTGFVLARAAREAGIAVEVVAPSKIARSSGERVKTDGRDAELLLRLSMAGQLRPVRSPSEAEEAARELVRLREQLRQDLLRARHRVTKLLLRHGRVWERAGNTWTYDHRRWTLASSSSNPRPASSSPSWSPTSTGCSLAAPSSTNASAGSRNARSCGRPSPDCAASAASRR